MNGRSRSTASRLIGSAGRATCGSRGSRRTKRAVTRKTVEMNQTIPRYAVDRVHRQHQAADHRAEPEADVQRRALVRHRRDPFGRGERVDRVDLPGHADSGVHGGQRHHHGEEPGEAAHERVGREQRRVEHQPHHPDPLRPVPVGEPAQRHRAQQRHPRRDGQPQPDLGGAEPERPGEEDGAAGVEQAAADGVDHGLHGQGAGQPGRRYDVSDGGADGFSGPHGRGVKRAPIGLGRAF